jgi:FeS assembly SUF system protein
VGLFSFLTGSKDEREEAVADRPEPSAQGPAPSAQSPTPSAQGTFTPPEAWNTEALTKPHPEPTGEKARLGDPDPSVTAELQGPVIEVIKTVFDPEIPVDIYELGLIYEVVADADRQVLVKMTLTSPACPSAQQIPSEVRFKVKSIPGVKDAWVDIVWDPPWDKDRMSEAAKLALGMY